MQSESVESHRPFLVTVVLVELLLELVDVELLVEVVVELVAVELLLVEFDLPVVVVLLSVSISSSRLVKRIIWSIF